MSNECECVWENDYQVYECEWCYHQYENKCICDYDENNPNCQECY